MEQKTGIKQSASNIFGDFCNISPPTQTLFSTEFGAILVDYTQLSVISGDYVSFSDLTQIMY